MKLQIFDKNNQLKVEVSASDNSAQKCDLMGDNVLNLSFTLGEYIPMEVNDYVDFMGQRFTLLSYYEPTQKSTLEYEYSPKFYGIESELKKALVLHTSDGAMESVFSLFDDAGKHVEKVVANINRIKGGNSWVVGTVSGLQGKKNIEYKNTTCFNALSQIADEFESEWWIEGKTINLCRCEITGSNPVDLGYNKGLLDLSKGDNSSDVKFFTRLFPLGSTRNIGPDYGFKRLQLPAVAGVHPKFVEQHTDIYGVFEEVEEDLFSNIYPQRVGAISEEPEGVKEVQRKIEGEERTIFYFSDSEDLGFNPNECTIQGKDMMIVFQSGDLAGRDFKVNWHDSGEYQGQFEIFNEYNEDNVQIPGGNLKPKGGDKYILYNINMPTVYYTTAEQKFKEAVDEYLASFSKDTSVYKGNSDYVYFREKELEVKLGMRVNLQSEFYFSHDESHSRVSRVTSFTRNVNNPDSYYIECTDAVGKGRVDKIESDISKIKSVVEERKESDTFTILKSWDSVDPSEWNVLSGKRTLKEIENRALSKRGDDVAEGHIRIKGGLTADEKSTFNEGLFVTSSGSDLMGRFVEDEATESIFYSTASVEEGRMTDRLISPYAAPASTLGMLSNVDEDADSAGKDAILIGTGDGKWGVNTTLANDVAELKEIVNPFTIKFISDKNTFEKGVKARILFHWIYSRGKIDSQKFDNIDLDVESRDWMIPNIFSDRTFTLTATLGEQTVSASVDVKFLLKKYYGVSLSDTLTNEQILALASDWAEREQVATEFDCTGGKYIYYILPAGMASGIRFYIGGLRNTDWTEEVREVTNTSGYTESYILFRLNNIQTGILNIEVK